MLLMMERSNLGMGKYSDKDVVITSGSSGMGLALAELLVQGGARVVITGRSQAKLDAARERLGECRGCPGGCGLTVRPGYARRPCEE